MNNVFRRYWTESEEALLMRTIRSRAAPAARRDAGWLLLLLKTGFRIGEFSRLTAGDARAALDQGWIFVPGENRKKDKHGKALDHQVPVTDPVKEALQDLLLILRLGGHDVDDGAPLVVSRLGRALSVRSYQDRIEYWCRIAGIPHASPHWARHTRAMRIVKKTRSNDPRAIVQAALGHASAASCGHYIGVTKEDLQRELTAIDGGGRVKKGDLRKRYEQRRGA